MGSPARCYDLFGVGAAVQGASSVIGASLQASATKHAADLTSQSAANSLAFQQKQYDTNQENQAPWLAAGKGALGQLSAGTQPGGQFMQAYGKTFDPGKFDGGPAFQAPDGVTMQNDPGYAFRLAEGQKALERSGAAKGTGTGGAALKAAARYGQDYASNEYGNVYNRALQGYQTNFNDRLNAYQTNASTGLSAFNTNYNTWSNDQSNGYNRLAGLAGVGQTAANQLNASGQAAAGNVAGINTNLGNQLGSLATQQGNAYAAGAVGVGNAINGGINNYQNNQILQQVLAQRGSGYGSV